MVRCTVKNGKSRGYRKDVDLSTEKGRRKYWMCQRKGKYPSERKALTEVARLREGATTSGNPSPVLSAYHCRECKSWRLTKRRQDTRADLKAFDVVPD